MIDCVLVPIHSHPQRPRGRSSPSLHSAPRSAPGSPRMPLWWTLFWNSSSEMMRAHESLRSNGSDSRALITPSFSLGPASFLIRSTEILLARYPLLAVEDNSRVIPRQVDDKHQAALEIITYVGMGLSILGNILSVLVQWKWAWVRVSSCVTFILNLFRGIYLELRKRSRFETRTSFTQILFSKRFCGVSVW